MSRPSFHEDAACREAPLSVTWFPGRGQSTAPAVKICASCLAADECLVWALDHGDDLQGIWSGTTQRQRQRMRRAGLATHAVHSPYRLVPSGW